MQTRLTELLNVDHPIMLAGMGGVSYNELVAAVSEAGGFGCLGASVMGTDEMVSEIAAALLAVISLPASLTGVKTGVNVVPVCALMSTLEVATGNRSGVKLLTYICVPSHSTACAVMADN